MQWFRIARRSFRLSARPTSQPSDPGFALAGMDAAPPPMADGPPGPGVAEPSAESIKQTLTRLMLDGDELDKVSVGALRKSASQSLGLPADGLDARSVEVQSLVAGIVNDLAGWWSPEVDDGRALEVYLVTFAAVLAASSAAGPAAQPLRTLDQISRENIRDAILDVFRTPPEGRRPGRPKITATPVVKMVIFLELPKHFHVALKLSGRVRFAPYKAALRIKHGLASHWSTKHTMFWSAARYGTTATAHKPVVDVSPLTWTQNNEPLNLFAESQEPFMATVVRKRRESAAMRPDPVKLAKGSAAEKFSKLDLTALIISEDLKTPAQVLAYVKRQGSVVMQAYVNRYQGRLHEYIEQAFEWSSAESIAQVETESDWSMLQRLAGQACSCEGECSWSQAAKSFFERNAQTLDGDRLAACVAAVVQAGPAKTRRIPLLVGPSNAGKSTIFDPVDNVFGANAVFHTPAMGSPMALANLAVRKKRFLYLDDYRPVEYARSTCKKPPTIPVVTFLKLTGGQCFEVQVSQSFQNGNVDLQWSRGAAMTAKDEGLWQPSGNVTVEDIRHMQSRVEQFTATVILSRDALRDVPLCKESWALWVTSGSAAFAARTVPAAVADASGRRPDVRAASGPMPATTDNVSGFADMMAKAVVGREVADRLHQEMKSLGVIAVQELTSEDWKALKTWQEVLPFAQRRIIALVQ